MSLDYAQGLPVTMEGPRMADVVIFVGVDSAAIEGESDRGRAWVRALPHQTVVRERVPDVKDDAEAEGLTVRVERIERRNE